MIIESINRIEEMTTGNYDFIKWVIGCIKELQWIDNNYDPTAISFKRGHTIETVYLHSKGFRLETYPLLLTRAVESINENDPWKIDIFYHEPSGWNWSYKDYMNLKVNYLEADRAKEAALSYVKEYNTKRDIESEKKQLLKQIETDMKDCFILVETFNINRPGTDLYKRFSSYIEDAKSFLTCDDIEKYQLIDITLNKIKDYFRENKTHER